MPTKKQLCLGLGVLVLAGAGLGLAYPAAVGAGLQRVLPDKVFGFGEQAWVATTQRLGELRRVSASAVSTSKSSSSMSTGTGSSAVHKCLTQTPGSATPSVAYSSEKCAAGSRELALDQGTVTVLPALRAEAASAASSLPTVRELLAPPADVNLQERRLERIINQ